MDKCSGLKMVFLTFLTFFLVSPPSVAKRLFIIFLISLLKLYYSFSFCPYFVPFPPHFPVLKFNSFIFTLMPVFSKAIFFIDVWLSRSTTEVFLYFYVYQPETRSIVELFCGSSMSFFRVWFSSRESLLSFYVVGLGLELRSKFLIEDLLSLLVLSGMVRLLSSYSSIIFDIFCTMILSLLPLFNF